MEITWTIIGALLILGGIVGSVAPLLPGPPLSYLGFLVVQLRNDPPFTMKFMLIWAGVVIVVSILEYVIPVYGTKKFGGSKYGLWGCTIGLFAGIFFGPWGIILAPFLGAFIGEMIANNQSDQALKAALGSFLGFLFSTLLKLVVSVVMAWYFVIGIWF
ncbi:MAG TPA: DUF456 domain-containing protein [Cyclobacteriaceae bacterium]|nr:DUF456 domain-containing protein [Cyclobacteriaceae bacterium]